MKRSYVNIPAGVLWLPLAALLIPGCGRREEVPGKVCDIVIKEFEVGEVIKTVSRSYRIVESGDTSWFTMGAAIQWPEKLGSYDIAPLQTHLLRTAFGDRSESVDVDAALRAFVSDTSILTGQIADPDSVEVTAVDRALRGAGELNDYRMDVVARIIELNGETVTYDVMSASYLGGPHANTTSMPFTYVLAGGMVLDADNLFIPDSLRSVSAAVNAVAAAQAGVRPGRLKRAGYYADTLGIKTAMVYLEDNAIVFRYNPYDVAPYSQGEVNIAVPAYMLDGLIAPCWRELFDQE